MNNRDTDSAVELHRAVTAAICGAYQVQEIAAAALADDIVTALRAQAGCQTLYIPAPNRELRDARMREEFDGRNHSALARRYGVCERRVRQILAGE